MPAAAARGPRPRGRGRRATTRWSRPGTGWRSAGSASPGTAARRAGVRRGRGRGRRAAGRRPRGRRAAAPGVPRRRRRPPAGVLEDYGCVAAGFLDLAAGDRRRRLAGARRRAARRSRSSASRAGDGGFFDTADDAEALVARPRDPSRQRLAERARRRWSTRWSTYAALTGSGRHREAAEAALATVAALAERAPRFAGWSLAAAAGDARRAGGDRGRRPAGRRRGTRSRSRARRRPGAVVVVADGPRDDIPLLVGRTPVDGRPAAYVCRGFVCERPVTDTGRTLTCGTQRSEYVASETPT